MSVHEIAASECCLCDWPIGYGGEYAEHPTYQEYAHRECIEAEERKYGPWLPDSAPEYHWIPATLIPHDAPSLDEYLAARARRAGAATQGGAS